MLVVWIYYGRSCCFTLRGATGYRYKNALMTAEYSNFHIKTIFTG